MILSTIYCNILLHSDLIVRRRPGDFIIGNVCDSDTRYKVKSLPNWPQQFLSHHGSIRYGCANEVRFLDKTAKVGSRFDMIELKGEIRTCFKTQNNSKPTL